MQILRTASIPGTQPWRGQGNALTELWSVASILGALGLWILDNASAAISLSVITVALSGYTAAWRFKRHGLDPLAVFCLGFSLYDGVLLFRLATAGEETVLPYPV